VARVSAALGTDSDRFTLVGGSAVALVTDERVPARPTEDVELVTHASSQIEAHHVEALLAKAGFRHDLGGQRPFRGAFLLEDIEVDVAMTPVGHTNPWYSTVREQSEPRLTLGLRVATPLGLLATKLVAYRDRGRDEPLASHDLEDIVALLLSHPRLVEGHLRRPSSRMARHVVRELSAIAKGKSGRELIQAHAGHDLASQERGYALWEALCRLGSGGAPDQ